MFNQQKTPSYFLKKQNLTQSLPTSAKQSPKKMLSEQENFPNISSSKDVVKEDVREISKEGGEVTSYKSVSVCTRWGWDDIFQTINTTNQSGNVMILAY